MNFLPIYKSIYRKELTEKNCFLSTHYYNIKVYAEIRQYFWLCFKWYHIHTFRPQLCPYYDGDYHTINRLKISTEYCKEICKQYLNNLKNG